MTAPSRVLTRREAKALTRRRLLDAALTILDEEGESALTTVTVTRGAGISQSSFYVHFSDIDDLLHHLIEELAAERRTLTRGARHRARLAPGNEQHLRDTFRIPLQNLVAHPPLLRLLLRTRHDPTSQLGEWSRELYRGSRDALIDDLVAAGLPHRTRGEKARASMIADGVIALTETLALGHVEGRYPDLEDVVDVLIAFSRGYFPMLGR